MQASNNAGILNTCTRLWLTESEQATPVVSIKDVVRSSVKVPEFNKHLKKAEGHIGWNVVEITIKMKTIVRKPLMIKKLSTTDLYWGCLENLLNAMQDSDEWRRRVREIHARGMTCWYIYIYNVWFEVFLILKYFYKSDKYFFFWSLVIFVRSGKITLRWEPGVESFLCLVNLHNQFGCSISN